jgi:hypothetical protein
MPNKDTAQSRFPIADLRAQLDTLSTTIATQAPDPPVFMKELGTAAMEIALLLEKHTRLAAVCALSNILWHALDKLAADELKLMTSSPVAPPNEH